MGRSANPFFGKEDFRSLEFHLEGTNLTSQVRILPGSITLVEILENGLSIEVPPRSCSVGHQISLRLRVSKPSGAEVEELEAELTGVVDEVEGRGKERQHLRLSLRQFSREQWDSLLAHLSRKQETANELIRNTRR